MFSIVFYVKIMGNILMDITEVTELIKDKLVKLEDELKKTGLRC